MSGAGFLCATSLPVTTTSNFVSQPRGPSAASTSGRAVDEPTAIFIAAFAASTSGSASRHGGVSCACTRNRSSISATSAACSPTKP